MHSDAKLRTDAQPRKLCEMMFFALIEKCLIGWDGKAERAALRI